MKKAHLTSIERTGHSTFRVDCLCGWETTATHRLVREARKEANRLAYEHWYENPVVTGLR